MNKYRLSDNERLEADNELKDYLFSDVKDKDFKNTSFINSYKVKLDKVKIIKGIHYFYNKCGLDKPEIIFKNIKDYDYKPVSEYSIYKYLYELNFRTFYNNVKINEFYPQTYERLYNKIKGNNKYDLDSTTLNMLSVVNLQDIIFNDYILTTGFRINNERLNEYKIYRDIIKSGLIISKTYKDKCILYIEQNEN